MGENQPKKNKKKKLILGLLAAAGVCVLLLCFLPKEVAKKARGSRLQVADITTEDAAAGSSSVTAEDAVADASGDTAKTPLPKKVAIDSINRNAASATVMLYMNGSDLESENAAASEDIAEILSSGIGKNVNVIIQTMGTKRWHDYNISADHSQTYRVNNGKLDLVRDDLGQLDCTSADTLSEFIGFCKTNYPSDRYMFIFWDHGAGPVYGFGYDEWQSEDESLTLDEMVQAFKANSDINFDIIGMDCCIMASMETCYALAPYCKYTLLSEDFESGIGWYYSDWMQRFEKDPGLSTPMLGKYIVDNIISENESNPNGDTASVGLFNEAAAAGLFSAWKTYAYQNEDALLGTNYSRVHKAKGRPFEGWDTDESYVTLSDFYISDMLALIESVEKESEAAKNLTAALKTCVAYFGHTSDKNELTGLSVSLPYGDPDYYQELKSVYGSLGFGSDYIDWLGKFVDSTGSYYDYGSFENGWGGWSDYEQEYGPHGSGGFPHEPGSHTSGGANGPGSHSSGSSHEPGSQPSGGSSHGQGIQNDTEYFTGDEEWTYDYDQDLWYLYDGDMIYYYDEYSDMMYCYDEIEELMYYYDDFDGEWYLDEDYYW